MGAVAPLGGFRADIQALRGLAVLAVVLFHADAPVPGGFTGVDMFFVISGFVIGRLLLAELDGSSTLSFRGFYARRARRLLPALAATLVVVMVLAPLLAPLGAVATTTRTGVAASLFSANLYLYKATAGGYFAPAADLNPLLHTWSLSVEEQFYFVMPALVLGAWRLGRRSGRSLRAVRVVLGLAIAASFASCVFFTFAGTIGPIAGRRFAFFSPVTRAWEFGIGVALVLLPARWVAGRRRAAFLVLGGVLLAASLFLVDEGLAFPGVTAAVPVLGTALVILGATRLEGEAPVDGRGVLRPFVWMGDRSYSWYLWHWPFIVFAAAVRPGSTPVVLTAALLSLLPAMVSYALLEQRFRLHRGQAPGRLTAPRVAAVCIGLPLVAAVLAVPITRAVSDLPEVAQVRADYAQHTARAACHNATPLDERDPEACRFGEPSSGRTVVLLGDSNAAQFNEAFIGAAEDGEAALQIATMSACQFLVLPPAERGGLQTDECADFVEGSIEAVRDDPPKVVVVAAKTEAEVVDGPVGKDPLASIASGDRARAARYERGLAAALEQLGEAGSTVVLVQRVPLPGGWDPRSCSALGYLVDQGGCMPDAFPVDRTEQVVANEIERRAAAEAGAVVWNINDIVCPDGECTPLRDGHLVWRDGTHVSIRTTEEIQPAVAAQLEGLLGGD